jgi:lipopolysaccharide export system protein LptA
MIRASLYLLAVLLVGAAGLRAADELQPNTVIDSDHLDYSKTSDTEATSFFTGHVVVTGTNLRITCDRLEIISTSGADQSDTIGQQDQFKYILATGHVHIVQGDREATCGRAEVLPRDNKITLTESPSVTDRGNGSVADGDKITLLRGQRRVIIEHAHMVGPPVKDLGFDKNQKAPAPAPAP